MKLPINCCCDAGRTLGFVDVPEGTKVGDEVSFCAMSPDVDTQLKLPVGECHVLGDPIFLAIKSNDTPMETLRQIPGFEEYPPPATGTSKDTTYLLARNKALVARGIMCQNDADLQEEIFTTLDQLRADSQPLSPARLLPLREALRKWDLTHHQEEQS